MTKLETLQLKLTATRVRMGVIEATHGAGCGHPGGSLSAADVLTYLYFREMRIDPEQPQDPNRDRFVLSKGHCAPGLYATLAERGFFPVADLPTLRHSNSYLQGHPNMNTVPGVDMSTGSLGQGVSAACGMALAAKQSGSDINVYTLLGDGEIEEGECWEAFMFANHYKLDNLCIMVDVNGLQIDGATRDVMNSEPLDKKMDAFGFNTIVCNGNSFSDLEQAFKMFDLSHGSGWRGGTGTMQLYSGSMATPRYCGSPPTRLAGSAPNTNTAMRSASSRARQGLPPRLQRKIALRTVSA